MTSTTRRPLWRGRSLALIGIVLFALSLRSGVAALSPLFARIEADFTLPAWLVGLIGTAPPVCFAVFGVLAPGLERRLGLERLAVIAMGLAAVGLIGRALAPDAVWLLVATAVLFAGVGVGNVLTPPLVKAYFPDRIGTMTAVYTSVMAVSTFLPALIAVPLADAASWRVSLGWWGLLAAAATVPWIAMLVRHRATDVDLDEPNPSALGRMLRLPMAWAVTVTFAVSSGIAYTSFAWLPVILVDTAGVSAPMAGTLLSLFAFVGLLVALIAPPLVARWRVVGWQYVVAVTAAAGGILGLLFAPAAAPWLWATLLGLGPLLFPLALTLIGVRTRTHEGAVALSGFVQSVGYATVAAFPVAVGVIHEVTGSWSGGLWLLLALIAFAVPAGILASRARTVEDEWEQRRGTW